MSDNTIEIVNDVAERKYRLRFGRRGTVLVDPDAWDGYAEAKLSDVQADERVALKQYRAQLAALDRREQAAITALADQDATGAMGESFYDSAIEAERRTAQQTLNEAFTAGLIGLLLPYLVDDNPDITEADLRKLRGKERRQILNFFVTPEDAAREAMPTPPTEPTTATPPQAVYATPPMTPDALDPPVALATERTEAVA